VKESITLAFALTINNLAGGVGAGLSGLSIPLTTAITFVLSVLAIICGYFLGEKFTTKLSGKTAGILSASLIICIAIYEFFNNWI
jgi:putative Mn2+ efflux pump MntP